VQPKDSIGSLRQLTVVRDQNDSELPLIAQPEEQVVKASRRFVVQIAGGLVGQEY
jgi:hypothetical protein